MVYSWSGEEGGREINFNYLAFRFWDRSVGLGEQLWECSLEGPWDKIPVSPYPGHCGVS